MKKIIPILVCLAMLPFIMPIGAEEEKPPLQLAIYPFNAVGVDATLGTVVTNAVYRELIKSKKLVVRDQNSTEAAIKELGMSQTGFCADDACKIEVGKIIKAQKLLMGTVEKIDENLYTISMRVVDVQTGATEYQAQQDCPCAKNVEIRDLAIQLANSTILVYLETGEKPESPSGAVSTSPSAPISTPIPAPKKEPSCPNGDEMVKVPAGEFIMGSDSGEKWEMPAHTVYLDEFYIDKYEVTVEQYNKCENKEPEPCTQPEKYDTDPPRNPCEPVRRVTWYDAKRYCEWLGKRLLTEAEWEKAARGTDGRTYPWGEGLDCYKANYAGCYKTLKPVGSFPSGASPYGAMDMAGNSEEWVADWVDLKYYRNSPGKNPTGPVAGQYKVTRGGEARISSDRDLATWHRSWTTPSIGRGQGYALAGFRCAKDGK